MAGKRATMTAVLLVCMAADERDGECTLSLLSTLIALLPAVTVNVHLAYHLMMDCEQLWTRLLVTPVALIKLYGSGGVCMAWTDFGTVGVVRRTILGRSDKFSQGWALR